MKKIIVACDSFKGCLSSREVAAAVAGALRACGVPQVVELPVADGGEGTVEALVAASPAAMRWVECEVPSPLPELPPVQTRYAIDAAGATAYLELAQASGLALVPHDRRDIMRASTLGTGLMLLDAVEHGCTHLVLGLGGSATCDGGMGVLAALGVEFVDALGHLLPPCAESLAKVHEIDCTGLRDDIAHARVTLLADVDNPLCGPQGAARVFSPQKGATPAQVEAIEAAMQRFARLLGNTAMLPGAGAAGGVGAALTAFLPMCRITPGAQFVLERAGLARHLAGADLVITGEGRIDAQTAMGKIPWHVAETAWQHGVPVVALCGSVAGRVQAHTLGMDCIVAVTPPHMPLDIALRPDVARTNLRRAAGSLLTQLHLTTEKETKSSSK
ncbi:MAG: glycerate kinase [Muribaculaceae bacterium]|nr:glycerate kinase [Muribaculaceae bacterium]